MMSNTIDSINQTETKFRSALNSIAHDPRFTNASFDVAISFIAETAGEVLGCERASIWRYSEDPHHGKSIHCLVQFDRSTGSFIEGRTLREEEAGSYLNALDRDTLLIIDDVKSDPRCRELNRSYLPSHDIHSLLDAPFQFNGQLGGVLCCEHTGSTKAWSVSEQHFAANMASLVAIASERSQRLKAEEKLRDEEHRYRSLVQDLAMGLVIIVDAEIVYANTTAADITHQKDRETLVGLSLGDLFPSTPKTEIVDWEKSSNTKQRATIERELTLNNGTHQVLEITTSTVSWFGSAAVQAIFRDVTEESIAKAQLKRSERLLSQAQHIARMGSWVWDIKSDETECSLELRKLLGIKGGNPLSAPILSMTHAEDVPRLRAAMEQAIQTKESYQLTYRVNTGNEVQWLEEIGVPELGSDGEVIRIHGTSRDVTRQKAAELEAMATEERFSALGNIFPGGFLYCDLAGRFQFINDTFTEWFDINAEDYIGKAIPTLIGDTAYGAIIEPNMREAIQGNTVTFEAEPQQMKEGITHIQCTLAPDVNIAGEIRGVFALVTDITETRNMEQALRQAYHMEAMGQLTGGIAHDFNNILAMLMGNLELASHNSSNAASRDYIKAALQGVERGVTLTQKLLGFARSSTPGTKEVKIDRVIDDLSEMIKHSSGSHVQCSVETDADLWTTEIDPGDFEDALINLCANARDAMPSGGNLIIKTANRTLDETSRRIHPALRPGDYVLMSVTDTGIGMDAKTKSRLFDPFFTTKPEGKGTGLGMSMVFGFVKRSRGQIVVYAAEGEGATINIYLPRYRQGHELENQPVPVAEQPTAHESILIVDDEIMVADVTASILSELGYQTQIATSSKTALDMIRDNPRFDLLLSDVVMPDDSNGFELAKSATAIQPSLKVLLTSGFSKFQGTEPDDKASRALASSILTKPYNRQELTESVRSILNSDGSRAKPKRAGKKRSGKDRWADGAS